MTENTKETAKQKEERRLQVAQVAVERTTLSAAAAKYAEQQVKGEYVLVIHGADAPDKASWSLEEAVAFAEREIQAGASKTEAAKAAAAKSGLKKGDIYKALTQ